MGHTDTTRARIDTLVTALHEFVADIVRAEVRRAIGEVNRADEYLSTRAAAKLADVSVFTIRRWVRDGRLVEHRAGSGVRVRRSELEELLRGGRRRQSVELTPEERAHLKFGDPGPSLQRRAEAAGGYIGPRGRWVLPRDWSPRKRR